MHDCEVMIKSLSSNFVDFKLTKKDVNQFGEVEFSFETIAKLEVLLSHIHSSPDFANEEVHVIFDTLNYTSQYSGERCWERSNDYF
jgi:PP-loop superfamily ATP-utilizing enzyme